MAEVGSAKAEHTNLSELYKRASTVWASTVWASV